MSLEEITMELNKRLKNPVSESWVKDLVTSYRDTLTSSLSSLVHPDEGEDRELIDFIPNNNGKDHDELTEDKDLSRVILNEIHNLETDQNTRTILEKMLYGNGTLKQISRELGISYEICRQHFESGKRMLRSALSDKEVYY